MSREAEVVTYLRADTDLGTLLPGGIYASSDLSVAGLTDRTMTDVWAGGEFQPTAIVRQRAPVPTGALQSIGTKHTSMSQVVEVWVYATENQAIEDAFERVYALMMGKRLSAAFSATWVGSGPGVMQAPELPAGIKVDRQDFRVVSIRFVAAV